MDVKFLITFLKLHQKYGEIVSLPFGFSRKLLLCGVKPLEFLLSSNILIDKGDDYQHFKRWLGDSTLINSGSKWRKRRKLLTPGFYFNILDSFVEVFDKHCDVLMEKLENLNGSFDICPFVKLYTLDVICESVMSTSINAQNNSQLDYIQHVHSAMQIVANRMLSPLKSWEFIYKFTAEYKKELEVVQQIHNFSNSVIEKRIQERVLTNSSIGNTRVYNKKPSFLDILLSSKMDGLPVPQEVIREEVDTFMFAGHDTTSVAISFLLYSLSKHWDIQEKCFEEIVGTNSNDRFTSNDLREMKYLEQVIKESVRMYTPAVFVTRTIKKDTYYNGQLWPKNLQVILFLYGLHHQPSLYPNPEVFDPERFSLENSKNRSLYSYVPFSAGPRNCIGQKFAMQLIKTTVANILRNFKILPALDHVPIIRGDSLLYSENGLLIQLQKRN
ncbi:hypothetical protein FQR65_LT03764 [Abscondita terminalis]|nr:hypothetical protein FQR65_LT03764 [Abscondita terminalis]